MKIVRSIYVDENVWLDALVRARREWGMTASALIEVLLLLFLDGKLDALLAEELGRGPRAGARPAEELFGRGEEEW